MNRKDIELEWRDDIRLSPAGDIELATAERLTRQRIIRRLATPRQDYLWALHYGAGLGEFVGQPADTRAVEAIVQLQLKNETAVAKSPPPIVQVESSALATRGGLTLGIQYTDANSDAAHSISLGVGN